MDHEPMEFDDGETFLLMLGMDSFCDEYPKTMATAGEAARYDCAVSLRNRLRNWYDDRRVAAGNPPVYRKS